MVTRVSESNRRLARSSSILTITSSLGSLRVRLVELYEWAQQQQLRFRAFSSEINSLIISATNSRLYWCNRYLLPRLFFCNVLLILVLACSWTSSANPAPAPPEPEPQPLAPEPPVEFLQESSGAWWSDLVWNNIKPQVNNIATKVVTRSNEEAAQAASAIPDFLLIIPYLYVIRCTIEGAWFIAGLVYMEMLPLLTTVLTWTSDYFGAVREQITQDLRTVMSIAEKIPSFAVLAACSNSSLLTKFITIMSLEFICIVIAGNWHMAATAAIASMYFGFVIPFTDFATDWLCPNARDWSIVAFVILSGLVQKALSAVPDDFQQRTALQFSVYFALFPAFRATPAAQGIYFFHFLVPNAITPEFVSSLQRRSQASSPYVAMRARFSLITSSCTAAINLALDWLHFVFRCKHRRPISSAVSEVSTRKQSSCALSFPFTCCFCSDEFTFLETDALIAYCPRHFVCKTCAKNSVVSAIGNVTESKFPIQCHYFDTDNPQPCPLLVHDDVVVKLAKLKLLTPQELNRYQSQCLESAISKGRVVCPHVGCGKPMLIDNDEAIEPRQLCVYCGRSFCHSCQVPWHAGITCAAATIQREAESSNAKHIAATSVACPQCPRNNKCFVTHYRGHGCHHITHRVGYEKHGFCYVCGSAWPCPQRPQCPMHCNERCSCLHVPIAVSGDLVRIVLDAKCVAEQVTVEWLTKNKAIDASTSTSGLAMVKTSASEGVNDNMFR